MVGGTEVTTDSLNEQDAFQLQIQEQPDNDALELMDTLSSTVRPIAKSGLFDVLSHVTSFCEQCK